MTVPVYALSFVSFVISRIVTKCFHFCTCTKFNVSSAVESRGLAKPGANSFCMKQLSFNTIWFIGCPLRYGEPVDDRSHRLNTHPNSAHHCIENHAEKKNYKRVFCSNTKTIHQLQRLQCPIDKKKKLMKLSCWCYKIILVENSPNI